MFIGVVHKIVGVLIMAWMFLTPIFYSAHIIPANILPLFRLNPMYQVVMGYRYAILAGRMLPAGDFLYLAFVSFFTFAVGGILFRRLKPGFAEVL
jgi:ABC-type polysaccharide/polyol phosphate export permease